jgi:hypothetical protein
MDHRGLLSQKKKKKKESYERLWWRNDRTKFCKNRSKAPLLTWYISTNYTASHPRGQRSSHPLYRTYVMSMEVVPKKVRSKYNMAAVPSSWTQLRYISWSTNDPEHVFRRAFKMLNLSKHTNNLPTATHTHSRLAFGLPSQWYACSIRSDETWQAGRACTSTGHQVALPNKFCTVATLS